MKIGDLEWARSTGGQLDTLDFYRQVFRVYRVTIAELSYRFRFRKRKRFSSTFEDVRIPDSPLCKDLIELVESASSEALFNHCMRTFFWGSVIGKSEELSYDEEKFFACALLHDLGLTQEYSFRLPEAKCFAVEGALFAHSILDDRGCNYSDEVAEAISLHLNPEVSVKDGPEAYLLRAGSGLDVAGARYDQLSRDDRKAVLESYPRHGLKCCLIESFLCQRDARSRDRLHALCTGGFQLAVKFAPFRD